MAEELVAVVGGNGFIGRRLVELLLKDGCRVRVISRQGVTTSEGAEAVAADVSDAASMRAALEGAACVYSLTTGGGDSWKDYERDVCSGALNLAGFCLEQGVRRLVFVSSIAALYLGADRTLDDAEAADPHSLRRSYYSRAKAVSERELLALHRSKGLPVVIARPGVVMGPAGLVGHSGLGLWATDVDCIGWGFGNHPLPFVLVDDVAEALRRARTAPGIEGLAFNLAGDVTISARQFVGEYAERSKRIIRFHARPLWQLWAVDVLKWMVKLAARKAENPFPAYRDFASRSLRSRLACNVARQKLGWTPNADIGRFYEQSIEANIAAVGPDDLRTAA